METNGAKSMSREVRARLVEFRSKSLSRSMIVGK